MWFADDGAMIATSPATLQVMLDVAWVFARLHRWELRVKGISKTACMMTRWAGGVQMDVEGVSMYLPNKYLFFNHFHIFFVVIFYIFHCEIWFDCNGSG